VAALKRYADLTRTMIGIMISGSENQRAIANFVFSGKTALYCLTAMEFMNDGDAMFVPFPMIEIFSGRPINEGVRISVFYENVETDQGMIRIGHVKLDNRLMTNIRG